MAIPSIGPVGNTASTESMRVVPKAKTDSDAFQQVITNFLNDASSQQAQADTNLAQLAAGKTDSVHDVVLSLAKADLSFRMVLEIRNQLIESYQEIMRMQM